MSQTDKARIENKSLDQLINNAAKKVGAKKENDICHYIPGPNGGYIHHFTMRKMKTLDPEQLHALITKYVIQSDNPTKIAPKPRAARGSRKHRDQVVITKQDIERILNLARSAGETEIVRKFTQKKDLRSIKRELISSIRHGRVEQELWYSYSEAINSQLATVPAATVNV